jgi:hypothetical protein
MRQQERVNKRVVNNFYGKINNYYQAPVTFNAPVHNTVGSDGGIKRNEYTDEQVARAIEAICGEGKPLDTKVKWAAVYWYLRWQCNYPVKGLEFCERIASLPFTKKLDPECGYENIRKLVTLSFMNQDARQLDRVKPSQGDEVVFAQCRAVVISLSEELSKQNAPLE